MQEDINHVWPLSRNYEYAAELGLGLRLVMPEEWERWGKEKDFPLPQAAGFAFFSFVEKENPEKLRDLLPGMLHNAPAALRNELVAAASIGEARQQLPEGGDRETHNWIWHPDLQGRTMFADKMHEWTQEALGPGEAVGAPQAENHEMARVHSPSYIQALLEQSERGESALTPETVLLRGDRDRLPAAAGLAVLAAKRVFDDGIVFMETRPGSHHASRARAGGTCFINNLAISAAEALRRKGVNRVAIIDVDAHHGNGTEEIFRLRKDVYTVSLHQSPPWFPGTGEPSYRGEGAGHGYNLNLVASDREEWRKKWLDAEREILRYKPDLILLELSADAHYLDSASDLDLQDEDFFQVGASLGKLQIPLLAELGSSLSSAAWSRSLAGFIRGWNS